MNKIPLKRIATLENRHTLSAISAFIFLGLYFFTQKFHLGKAGYLPLSQIEQEIPFIDWSIWIYLATYPFIFMIVYEIKSGALFNKCFYAYYLLLGLSCAVFFFYPVSYPREMFPLFPSDNFHNRIFYLIRSADAPTNCLPSLHVASSFLFSFFMWHQSKVKGLLYIAISALMAISTLTTKQHYMIDVITGAILALALYAMIYYFTEVDSDL